MKPTKIKDSNRLVSYSSFCLINESQRASETLRFPAEIRWPHLTVNDRHTLHTCSHLHINWCAVRWTTRNLEFCHTRKRLTSTVLIYGNQSRMYRKTPRLLGTRKSLRCGAQDSVPFSRCSTEDSVASVSYVCQRRKYDEIYIDKHATVYRSFATRFSLLKIFELLV